MFLRYQLQQPGVLAQLFVFGAAAVHHQHLLPACPAQQRHAVPGTPAGPGNALEKNRDTSAQAHLTACIFLPCYVRELFF